MHKANFGNEYTDAERALRQRAFFSCYNFLQHFNLLLSNVLTELEGWAAGKAAVESLCHWLLKQKAILVFVRGISRPAGLLTQPDPFLVCIGI